MQGKKEANTSGGYESWLTPFALSNEALTSNYQHWQLQISGSAYRVKTWTDLEYINQEALRPSMQHSAPIYLDVQGSLGRFDDEAISSSFLRYGGRCEVVCRKEFLTTVRSYAYA